MIDSETLSLIVVGYVVGLPVVLYGILDLARIPARLYQYTPYSRPIWTAAIITGYACFGIGGILMVAAWIRSPERADLRDDLALDARWDHPVMQGVTTPVMPSTRAMRRRERARRHRWAAIAVTLPVVLVAAAVTRIG
jgi:hypothetical protein